MISNTDILKLLHRKGYSGEDLVPMLIRTRLLVAIKGHIQDRNWNQTQVAEILGVKQPRVSEIANFQVEKFSTELLFKYARRLGLKVTLDISA